MPGEDERASISNRLREANLQTRLQVIQSHFLLATTLCQTAETELLYGHIEAAQRIMQKIRSASELLGERLAEPHHVPPNSMEGFLTQLNGLNLRIQRIEQQLGREGSPGTSV